MTPSESAWVALTNDTENKILSSLNKELWIFVNTFELLYFWRNCFEGYVIVEYYIFSFLFWKAKPKDCLDLSRFLNDDMAETVRKYPSRFVGLGTLPLQDPQLAVEELKRIATDLKFPGVQIGSHVNDWNLDEPALYPVYKVNI